VRDERVSGWVHLVDSLFKMVLLMMGDG
jgi:hypothetical protein